MPLFCKSIHCFRPTFGKKSCKKHRCSTSGCHEPRHVGCTTCFTHSATQILANVQTQQAMIGSIGDVDFAFGSNDRFIATNSLVFGGQRFDINSF